MRERESEKKYTLLHMLLKVLPAEALPEKPPGQAGLHPVPHSHSTWKTVCAEKLTQLRWCEGQRNEITVRSLFCRLELSKHLFPHPIPPLTFSLGEESTSSDLRLKRYGPNMPAVSALSQLTEELQRGNTAEKCFAF